MWTLQYVISQILVVIGMLLLGVTYIIKNKNLILILSLFSACSYGLHYLLLGAYPAVIINVVGMIRCVWFFVEYKLNKQRDFWSLAIISILMITLGILTYTNWLTILAICAGLIFTYSLWQNNIAVYRYLAIVCSVIWIVHNTLLMSVMAIVTECVLLVIEIIGIIKLYVHREYKISQESLK